MQKIQELLMEEFYGPKERLKRFHKNAIVYNAGRIVTLRSYETIVCQYDWCDDIFYKCWDGYSRSTANHIRLFLSTYGDGKEHVKGRGRTWKARWESMKTTKPFHITH